jgi:SpoVK/Ycf46/Vps4 family AAA+-type ATPase
MKNINILLNRTEIENEIKQILNDFEEKCNNQTFKKGLYIYGAPGTGKTQFVMDILKSLNYDVINYDAGDIRNRSLIDTITSNNVSTRNVLDMMNKKIRKMVIVMDEIDGMNSGDKGGITALIKLIRQKKTKKQKLENITLLPIICIGNYYLDKKMKELMKVCYSFELKTPSEEQIINILRLTIPDNTFSNNTMQNITKFIQGDLRKLNFIEKVYTINKDNVNDDTIKDILRIKYYNEDSKDITKQLINNYIPLENHNSFMNETDRTIVALLWHENIIDILDKKKISETLPTYLKILKNYCFSDYMDRITFQHQIWQFNEMSSMNKTFNSNRIYHKEINRKKNILKTGEIRFTKVLTKYSTEYNNQQFMFNMSQKLDMDTSDVNAYLQELRYMNGKEYWEELNTPLMNALEESNITKLDVRRAYRYIDKNE